MGNITGSNSADTLYGTPDDDYIDGGDGSDIAVIDASASSASFSLGADGLWQVTTATTGTDTLRVEHLQFSDGVVTPGASKPPEQLIGSNAISDARQQSHLASATLADGGYVLAWQSTPESGGVAIATQRHDSNGNNIGDETRVETGAAFLGSDIDVAALDNGGFVVAWTLDGIVHAQHYDVAGNLADGPVVLTASGSDASLIALADGGYAAAWIDASQVCVNVFDDNGNPTRTEQVIAAAQATGTPRLAELADGSLVVTWTDVGVDEDIHQQRFDTDGNAVGTPVAVNTHVGDDQYNPDIAVLAGGNYVITWSSWRQDGGEGGIYAQRFDATGNPLGGEVRVNGNLPDDQADPAVAALTDGGYVIAWESGVYDMDYFYDGYNYDIFAREYDGDGIAIGDPLRVNTLLDGWQVDATLTALAGNDYLVAWHAQNYAYGLSAYARAYGDIAYRSGVLTGDNNANTLQLGNGAATLNGAGGNDTLRGGIHADALYGNAGSDRLEGRAGNDRITGGQQGDWLSGGAGSDTLTGSLGADRLFGGDSDDLLAGGGGNDLLQGGKGVDTLRGADGNDTFSFVMAGNSQGMDRITAFAAGSDNIRLDASGIGLAAGALADTRFITAAAAADADDRIIYDTSSGTLYYDADGNGSVAQVAFALLEGKEALTAGDFVIA